MCRDFNGDPNGDTNHRAVKTVRLPPRHVNSCRALVKEATKMMRPDHVALIQITLIAGVAAVVGEHALHLLHRLFGG